jgi:hypothetical protein
LAAIGRAARPGAERSIDPGKKGTCSTGFSLGED